MWSVLMQFVFRNKSRSKLLSRMPAEKISIFFCGSIVFDGRQTYGIDISKKSLNASNESKTIETQMPNVYNQKRNSYA